MLFTVDPGRDDGGLVHQDRMQDAAVGALASHLGLLHFVSLDRIPLLLGSPPAHLVDLAHQKKSAF